MLIVLEGVDGAGKSTLVDRLLRTRAGCDADVRMHCGPLKGDAMREYEWRLRDYVPGDGRLWVCDRWHVGELIYGPLYRGQSKLTGAMHRHVELLLESLGALRLVVTADMHTIMQRLETRGEDFLQPSHVGLVWDWYNEYAYRNGWRLVGSDENTEHLIREARRLESDAVRLQAFSTYVGPTHPRHLLLGDRHGNPRPNRPAYRSAFVPYPDTSGAFLLNALNDVRLSEYGLANAGQENVHALWTTLGRPNVVCLGREAEAASRTVPHQTVAHPQYVRRFQHGDRKAYGLEIQEMLRP